MSLNDHGDSPRLDANPQSFMDSAAALDPENYPFYHKVKRNLYIMEELLNDENNAKNIDADSNPDEGRGNRKRLNEHSNKGKN